MHLKVKVDNILRALFTKFLTPSLTQELCNPLNVCLHWLVPTNQRTDYIIRISVTNFSHKRMKFAGLLIFIAEKRRRDNSYARKINNIFQFSKKKEKKLEKIS